MKVRIRMFAALLGCVWSFCIVSPVQATIIWDWSFAGEAGQFITDGSLSGGSALADTYTITDFIVTASASGMALGSLSGGEYFDCCADSGFIWDGTTATQFFRFSGGATNGIDMFQTGTNLFYVFELGTGGIVDEYSGPQISGALTLSAATVPEPGTFALLCIGLAGLGFTRCRIKA